VDASEQAIADAKTKRQQSINLLITLIAVIIALIAVIIYRLWISAKKEKTLAEKEKILMELKALRAQMNPHFIFNAINSIQNFILDNDQDSAQKHLSRFSKLIRMVFENSGYENIPLDEEIKMLELYLEFEMVRFSSRFRYKITVDDSLDKSHTFIPPLIIQPYVENAVWHGLMHLKDRQGEVIINFERHNNQLKCTVDDNGIGRAHSMELKKDSVHKSMGLSITAERLEIGNKLFKSKMSVNFTDKLNKDGTSAGTRVELLVPTIINVSAHA
jgi:LytS/YehU family sensor histidine kinase